MNNYKYFVCFLFSAIYVSRQVIFANGNETCENLHLCTFIPLKIPNRPSGLESSRELPMKFESAPTEGADSNLRWSKTPKFMNDVRIIDGDDKRKLQDDSNNKDSECDFGCEDIYGEDCDCDFDYEDIYGEDCEFYDEDEESIFYPSNAPSVKPFLISSGIPSQLPSVKPSQMPSGIPSQMPVIKSSKLQISYPTEIPSTNAPSINILEVNTLSQSKMTEDCKSVFCNMDYVLIIVFVSVFAFGLFCYFLYIYHKNKFEKEDEKIDYSNSYNVPDIDKSPNIFIIENDFEYQ